MRRFFSFNGTISGSSFILRTLFSIVLSIPFLVLFFALMFSIVFSYMDITDFASAEGMSMAESNALGEKAGLKIAEDLMEMGTAEWFSQNISVFWIIAIIISLIPLIWFGLATYYKRVSALFYSNRIKAFIAFFIAEAALDIVALSSGNNTIFWVCVLIGLGIFGYLLFSNSPIGEHDG